jgi:hypothetical protein
MDELTHVVRSCGQRVPYQITFGQVSEWKHLSRECPHLQLIVLTLCVWYFVLTSNQWLRDPAVPLGDNDPLLENSIGSAMVWCQFSGRQRA